MFRDLFPVSVDLSLDCQSGLKFNKLPPRDLYSQGILPFPSWFSVLFHSHICLFVHLVMWPVCESVVFVWYMNMGGHMEGGGGHLLSVLSLFPVSP